MIVSMQGNWTVEVKSKHASYPQQFIINGATSGGGVYEGVVGGDSVSVTGDQWSIAIKNDPGEGFQLSDTKIGFPRRVGDNYVFDISSNDAGGDEDFNDLVLTCHTPVNINEFIVYGNVSLYRDDRCPYNPCRLRLAPGGMYIESNRALLEALKNGSIREKLEKDYPERIRDDIIGPNPPDPAPFKPIVIDLYNEAMQPRTKLIYKRLEDAVGKVKTRANKAEPSSEYSIKNYSLISIPKETSQELAASAEAIKLAGLVDGYWRKDCTLAPATNTTLTFEEYDRAPSELAGGPYTGTGNRRLLGDTIADMHGNYIFRFSFNMMYPDPEDNADIAPGETLNVAYPDVIVKVTSFSPYTVLYESAPYYNIRNLRRIDLCLPKSTIQPSSACFNGNLIGSLGNIFLGGNQNSSASFSSTALERYNYGNHLEPGGEISVGSSLAGFKVECASWYREIDFKGCMYDLAKTVAQNNFKWYTIRIRRSGVSDWQFVSQNYKHPKFKNRNIPDYIGDNVGPFFRDLHVDGGDIIEDVPAYINIQREVYVDGEDWEASNLDRYMQLNTNLYDKLSGITTPGKFYVRIDCYDNNGDPVANGTDMIALYIHNKRLNFGMTHPVFTDVSVENSGCGLYRLTDAQMNTPIQLSFKANDPEGFVHFYDLSMSRCPSPMIALTVNQPIAGTTPSGATPQPHPTTPAGRTTLFSGVSISEHNTCIGYTGTEQDFGDYEMINVEIQPAPSEGGWIKTSEYFTSLYFYLRAYKRMTNGYNTGLSDDYEAHAHIFMERKDT